MKKSRVKVLLASTISLFMGVTIFLCSSNLTSVSAAIYKTNMDSFFLAYDANGYQYKCYTLKDDQDHDVSGVAIAWGQNADETPDNYTIPSKVTHEEETFDVKVIAKGGFRHCDFKNITIPQCIEDIEEEAFAYCMNVKEFNLPSQITRIAPSTFLDCRGLEFVHYTNSNGEKVFDNEVIVSIGDHAFDSCVSLKDFYCPKNVTYFGESCFQKCSTLSSFYFPSTVLENSTISNYITVRSYAFADCALLKFVYFETNMKVIVN